MRRIQIRSALIILTFFACLGSVIPLWAKAETNPYLSALEEAFVKVAADVIPSVVSISAVGVVDDYSVYKSNPFHEQLPPQETPAWVNGSGFIFRKEGYILTSNHIVNKAEKVQVRLYNDTEYTAKLVGNDPSTDIAVLKIDGKDDFPALKLGESDNVKVGQWAIAIGNPYQLDFTVTVGIISAKGRSNLINRREEVIRYEDFIQTDAAINRGNSGGPLLNLRGEAIGVNSMIRASSPFDSGNIGIGFAVPINMATTVAKQLIDKGRVVRGWLGISMKPITDSDQKELNLKEPRGVKVDRLIKDSPAEKAGLQVKDIILEFDGSAIKDPKHLQWMVANTDVNKEVKLKVYREHSEKTMSVKIGEMPAEYITPNRPPTQTVDPPPPSSLRERIPQRK